MFSAWSGVCANVPRTYGCRITMTDNKIVAGTFEEIPQDDCGPDQSCDPVGGSQITTIKVKGKGTVVAPRTGSLSGKTCASYRDAGTSCEVRRFLEKFVDLKAIKTSGGKFRGWGGPWCSGTGTCHFFNRSHTSKQRVVIAYFG
jgi:hypothetical protein